ncbi:N-acetylmuramoyl-L-alanine amidase [Anaerostipes butyraticus]|nr:N-acetylmuramoyl-L-alanine amidase [Anaerostipes butyraticus]
MKKEDGMRKYLMLLILTACLCFGGCQKKEKTEAAPQRETAAAKETASTAKTSAAADEEKTTAEKEEKIMVAIDPGHQKEQMTEQEPIGPGASETKPMVSSGTEGVVTGEPEYQVNLEVSMKLKSILEARGYDVYMIRETNDVKLSNRKRAQMANGSGASVFLRLHCNSDSSSSANGALTMCPTEANPYCGEIASESKRLSSLVGSSLCHRTGARNRGVIETDQMSGINWCEIPVTIIEMGFMSNPEEDQKLSDDQYQNRLAEGIAEGVDRYFEE